MDLGTRMRRLRLEKGLTQARLAEPDYTFAYVSTIEAGRRKPSRAALEYFAAKLGVDPDELATGRSPGVTSQLLAEFVAARKALSGSNSSSVAEAETALQAMVKKARKLGLDEVELRARTALALAAELRNDTDTALALYEEAIRRSKDASPLARVDAVANRARVLQTRGEAAYAAFVLNQALAELEEAGIEDPSALVRLHSSLVAAYFGEGLIKQASDSAEIALTLATRVDNADRLGSMYLNVGILLEKQGRWKEAEEKLRAAERSFDEAGLRSELTKAQLVRAMNLRDQGHHDEARSLFTEVQAFFAQAGNRLSEGRALVASAVNERLAGKAEDARFALKRALTLAGEEKGVIGIAHRELGLCEADEKKAVKEIRKALEILKDGGNERELAATYVALGDVLSRKDRASPIAQAYRAAAEVMMHVG